MRYRMLYTSIAAFFDKVLTFTLGARFEQRPISAKVLTITHKLALLYAALFSSF
jgi:hypothetical protein